MNRKTPIYLDNNATTPVDPRVLEAMLPYFQDRFGNSSSKHSFGFITNSAVENSRAIIANLINASKEEVIFTSGATESINLVHLGIAEKLSHKGNHIISTVTEHSASFESLLHLQKKGFEITFLQPDKFGFVHPSQILESIRKDTILVSVIFANNEIGTINDIKSIGKVCKANNILFHTDATQAVGKIKVDVNELDIDFMSFTAHKIYGPKGIGALFIKKGNESSIAPISFGGGQEKGLRPGTLNVPAIVGFGKAAEICLAEMEKDYVHTKKLRDYLFTKVVSALDGVYLNGDRNNRLPGNLNLLIQEVKSDLLISSIRELAISTGATCSSETGKQSRTLKSIGLSDDESKSSIRIGIGRFNTQEEIDYASERLIEEITKLRSKKITIKDKGI